MNPDLVTGQDGGQPVAMLPEGRDYDRALEAAWTNLVRWAHQWHTERPRSAAVARELAEALVRCPSLLRLPEGGWLLSRKQEQALLREQAGPPWGVPRNEPWVGVFPEWDRTAGSGAWCWRVLIVTWDDARDLVRVAPVAQVGPSETFLPWVYALRGAPLFPEHWEIEPLCPENFEECRKMGVSLEVLREEAATWMRAVWHVLWVWRHPHTVRRLVLFGERMQARWRKAGAVAMGMKLLLKHGTTEHQDVPVRAQWVTIAESR